MSRIPTMTALRAFEAAARYLSIKEAAGELNLSPGAVSRQILALEATLGTPLFRRSHRKIELTPTGRSFLSDISSPLSALRLASERVRASSQKPVVSIVSYPTFAVRWLMPRWGRFLSEHPEIDLRLTTSLDHVEFMRGDTDLALQIADPRALPGKVASWKLMEVDQFPVAAPEVARGFASLDDLRTATLLHSAPRPDDWSRWLGFAGMHDVDGTAGLHFESLDVAMHAAVEGLGVAIAVSFLVAEDLRTGRLERPFDLVRRSSRPMHLLRLGPDVPEVRVVRNWLLAEAESPGPLT